MTSHLPRLLVGLLATMTLALTLGGSLGIWPTGAPAAARVMLRDMEGSSGDVSPRADTRAGGTHAADPGAPSAGTGPAAPDAGAGEVTGEEAATALPARSGRGRRVVFDESAQRVWLVRSGGDVRRTYPVSGSRMDNLDAGRYEVYSRSRHAVSYTYEETMDFMVRFAHGDNAAIGFHDIPVDQQGDPVQTRAQLGRPLSSGCIRQARPDAVALWRFADLGTKVVVVE